jgi:hypothetical protein
MTYKCPKWAYNSVDAEVLAHQVALAYEMKENPWPVIERFRSNESGEQE